MLITYIFLDYDTTPQSYNQSEVNTKVQILDRSDRDNEYMLQVRDYPCGNEYPRLYRRLVQILKTRPHAPRFATLFCNAQAELRAFADDIKVDHLIEVTRRHCEYKFKHYNFSDGSRTFWKMDGLMCVKEF
jgi:hypothetical protein|tara:strand:- start:79 stop:471 length:393 start_codon:yes stop_codon:yes gene_type:complete